MLLSLSVTHVTLLNTPQHTGAKPNAYSPRENS